MADPDPILVRQVQDLQAEIEFQRGVGSDLRGQLTAAVELLCERTGRSRDQVNQDIAQRRLAAERRQ